MSALVFVDTNVFLYAMDTSDPLKQRAASLWRDELWRSRSGRTSFQVLHEFYVKATQKWPKAVDATRAEIRDLLVWHPVVLGDGTLMESWKIQDRYRLSFWDSLIVAAAKASSSRFLLTEHFQHGQDLDGVRVTNPFRTDPSSIK
jgi:predicted nucleic acid-binding protein